MKKRTKFILFTIVGVAMLAGVFLFAWHMNRKSQLEQTASQNSTENLLGDTYTNQQAGVRFRMPKGWKQTRVLDEKLASVQFIASQPDKENGRELQAFGALKTTPNKLPANTKDPLYEHIQPISDAAVLTERLAESRSGVDEIGGRRVSFISYEQKQANGLIVKVAFYSFYEKEENMFYDFSFLMLPSAWEKHRPSLEASVASFEVIE